MRLARLGAPGAEIPVASGPDGAWRDIRTVVADIDGAALQDALPNIVRGVQDGGLQQVFEAQRFGAPLPDPQRLGPRLAVNEEPRQDGSTADMILGATHVVHYPSRFMVLHPGDVINTGSPAGVALGRSDRPYLRAGDIVSLSIDGLGSQRHRFVAAP